MNWWFMIHWVLLNQTHSTRQCESKKYCIQWYEFCGCPPALRTMLDSEQFFGRYEVSVTLPHDANDIASRESSSWVVTKEIHQKIWRWVIIVKTFLGSLVGYSCISMCHNAQPTIQLCKDASTTVNGAALGISAELQYLQCIVLSINWTLVCQHLISLVDTWNEQKFKV